MLDTALAIENVSFLHDKLGMIAANLPEVASMARLHQSKIVHYMGWALRDQTKEDWFKEACTEANDMQAATDLAKIRNAMTEVEREIADRKRELDDVRGEVL